MLREYFDDRVLGHQRLSRVFWLEGAGEPVVVPALLVAFQYGNATVLVLRCQAFIAYTAWIMRRIWLNAFNVSRAEFRHHGARAHHRRTINAVTVRVPGAGELGGQPLQFL